MPFFDRVPGISSLLNVATSQPRPDIHTPERISLDQLYERMRQWKANSLAAGEERLEQARARGDDSQYDVMFESPTIEAEATILYPDLKQNRALKIYWSDGPVADEVLLSGTLCTLSPTPCGRTGQMSARGILPIGSYQILTTIDKEKGLIPGPTVFWSLI